MKITGGNRAANYPQQINKPAVSIIIVTRNAGKFLQACLDSIISQAFQNIELLIFDAVSTDNTLEIIKHNEASISYWQSEPDTGIYEAMNKAVKQATGKWFYFLGADDELLEGFSEMAGKLQTSHTLYYGYCLRNDIRTGRKLSGYEIAKVNVCHHAVFYPSVVFKKYFYHTDFVVYADHALNIQCWGDTSIRKKYYPFAIAKYNHEGFSTWTKDEVFKKQKAGWIKDNMSAYIYLRYVIRKWKEAKKTNSDFF